MKRWSYLLILLLPLGLLHAAELKKNDIAPTILPGTTPAMHTAGFWISRHPDPTKVILSPKDILAWNKRVQDELKLTRDIFVLTQNFRTEVLLQDFEGALKDFGAKDYYLSNGTRDTKAYLDKARQNMYTTGVVLGVAPRYGLVVRYADVRFFPTADPLYESYADIDFDQVQNSTLDVGSAVAVVHQSLDKKWYYIYAQNTHGWVQADRVALGDVKTVKEYVNDTNFVVTIAAKGDIYLNESLTRQHDYVRMGARLPLVKTLGDAYVVRLPMFDSGDRLKIVDAYVQLRAFNQGYLPYTAQQIILQAFEMLNEPYGWGGMYGEQDCSAFLGEVFGTVGIQLPRDSKDQAQVGQMIAEFKATQIKEERLKSFKDVSAGSIILPMKGHIMLYLGNFNNKPYVIHAVWAYRVNENGKDVPKVINKVTVSDLLLGDGSSKGSLLKRLTKIVNVI